MKLEDNADGSVIVLLDAPVKFDGEAQQRITIPKLKGKHLRLATWTIGQVPTLGQLSEFAAQVVEPSGIFDDLDPNDARDVAVHVGMRLGKRPATGE